MSALLGLAALLCWPATCASARLAGLAGRIRPSSRDWPRRWWRTGLGGLALIVSTMLAWPGGGLAAALLGFAVRRDRRERDAMRTRLAEGDGFAEALRAMVTELRAGAHPIAAAESAAREATGEAARAMRTVAAAARLDGPFPESPGDGPLGRLTGAWTLAQRHGLPMAEVLDAVRRDVELSVRLARQADARLAGPRSSASVLAFLPCLGIALGQAMGADPARVLTATAPGQVLLVLGAGFIAAGLAWSSRLTRRVVTV
ncbi:type II secretion system F family protein [Amycolatopsis sp. NPDC059657]|uniref:type II secretion system F family protein n=1 Tax=Amycolatopsis sp. NPDC059657 TaxID=3346899 RepID=UPI003672A94B